MLVLLVNINALVNNAKVDNASHIFGGIEFIA